MATKMPVTIVPENGFTLEAYLNVLREGLVPRWAWNSLITSAAVTLITVAISALAGYALSRLRFAGRQMVVMLIVASIINIFLRSGGVQFAISTLGVLIFAGLTYVSYRRIWKGVAH